MSDMNHSRGSASTRRSRKIKVAPMTRAVRMALAASVAALALGAGNGAVAANCKAPARGLMPCSAVVLDATPVVDLTVIREGAARTSTGPMFAALAIDESDTGDVVIDNADPITEIDLAYDVTSISGYSSGGDVQITNHPSADLYAGSVFGNAIGIYAYSATGTASVDNSADIGANSYAGIADGIFAAGVDVEVSNSGAIETYSYSWTAGIEAESTDSTVVTNSGDITVSAGEPYLSYDGFAYYLGAAQGGHAKGIYATAGAGGIEVSNSGNIYASGGYVVGIEAAASGDITIDNSGSIATGPDVARTIDYSTDPYGIVTLTGAQIAYGIDATSSGEGAAVRISNSGDIEAAGRYGGTGISATASGYGGTAEITNSGTIFASQYAKYGYGAYGVVANADGDATSTNSGSIEVYSGGSATGAAAMSFAGDASVTNSGDIEVIGRAFGNNYSATGVLAFAVNGTVYANNSGTINVSGEGYLGRGIDAQGYAGATVVNSGSLDVDAKYGYGIYAVSNGGDTIVDNTAEGEIGFTSTAGNGSGIFAVSVGGDVSVHNAGVIEGRTMDQAIGVFGLSLSGDVDLSNSGSIDVATSADTAVGMFARAWYGTASVANSGDITVSTFEASEYVDNLGYLTYGVLAQGGNVEVSNSGDITVDGEAYAAGIVASALGDVVITSTATGSINVHAPGMLVEHSYYVPGDGGGYYGGYGTWYYYTVLTGSVSGINAESASGDVLISNASDITAGSELVNAIGINAIGAANVTVGNSGDIEATTTYGLSAYGVFAAGAYVEVENSGSIDVLGLGYASGIAAVSLYGTTVANAGDIDVSAPGGYVSYYGYYRAVGSAFGINAQSLYGHVSVSNSGDITATSDGVADVAGINAVGPADITVTNGGDIAASTLYGEAYGINAVTNSRVGGTTTVNNSGDITVVAPDSPFGHANGISAFRQYEGDVVVGNSGDIDVQAGGRSYGVYAHTKYGDVSVSNSGDITMLSQTDAQTGIQISAGTFFAGGGDASVLNSGDISIDSGYGLAVGIGSIAGAVAGYDLIGNSYIFNSGDIEASAEHFAYGIQARGAESATVVNTGDLDVYASVTNGSYYNFSTAGGIAVLSFAGGDLSIENAGDITANSYEDAFGFYANGGSVGNISITNAGDVGVHSQTTTARGVIAKSYYGNITVDNGGSIVAIGDDAALASVGVHVTGRTGDVVVNNAGDIHAEGSMVAIGVLFQTYGATTTINNASTGSISADGDPGYAWAVYGSYYAADTINNAGLIAGSIALYGGDDVINNLAGGTLRLDGGVIDLGSGVEGNAFNNAGTIRALGDSVIDMGSGGAVTLVPSLNPLPLVNTGSIDLLDGAADDSLTIVGDLGGNGALNIDVSVPDNAADRLIVDGSMVAGAVQTVNATFHPSLLAAAQSGEAIDFAWVSGNSTAGSFVGGQVIGEDASNFLDLGVVVTSSIDAANASDDVFSIGVTVDGLNDTGALATNAASGAAGMLAAQVGTFKQRMGVNPYGDAGKVMSAFFRTYTSEGDVNPVHASGNFGQGGNFAYDQSVWGREVGINANLSGNFHAGVVLGTADGRQRLTGEGVGSNRMDGMTWGLYATWFAPQGFYVDVSGRWMAVDIVSTSAAGQLSNRAHTGAWNLEAGYEWKLGGLSVVPQVQYTRTEVDGISALQGAAATFQSHDGTSSRGRVGVEVSKTFESASGIRWTPYGSINAIREFDGEMGYTVAGAFTGSTSTKGTSTMAELGVGVQKGGWGFTLGANWLDGGAFKSTIGGQAIVRFAW